jgi:hypothetical protein
VIQSRTLLARVGGCSVSCAFVPRPAPMNEGPPSGQRRRHHVAGVDLRAQPVSGLSTSARSTASAEVEHEPDPV